MNLPKACGAVSAALLAPAALNANALHRLGAIPVDEFANCVGVGSLELKLLRTADFDCSRSGSFRMVLGALLRLFFGIPAVCGNRDAAASVSACWRVSQSLSFVEGHHRAYL